MGDTPVPEKAPDAAANPRGAGRAWIPVAAGVVIVGLLGWRLWSAVEPAGPARGTAPYHPTAEMPAGLRAPQINTLPRSPFLVSPALRRTLLTAREHLANGGTDNAANTANAANTTADGSTGTGTVEPGDAGGAATESAGDR